MSSSIYEMRLSWIKRLCYMICSQPGDMEQYITPAGFQFLLLDMASQVWFFMLQYLHTSDVSGTTLVLGIGSIFITNHGFGRIS